LSLEVLASEVEIRAARAQLVRKGISGLEPRGWSFTRLFNRLLRRRLLLVGGEPLKSWDVLRTAEFIGENFARDARVLDQGADHSEILLVLHRMGYRRLTGMDFDPRVVSMPRGNVIQWQVGDFLRTGYPDSSFEVITSISAIEHGFDADRLLSEVSRLLVPGGCFLVSFDYWPEKVSTEGVTLYGLPWLIFSRDEVQALLDRATSYGLRPVGRLSFEARERPIHFASRDYTFAWLALRKESR
jgi:SAM-dependent methyltransferase